jgi:hypothetical protein
MFGWLKSLFGVKEEVVPTPSPALKEAAVEAIKTAEAEQAKPVAEPKAQAKKPAKKTKAKKDSSKCDFSKLTKAQLLAEAKHRGVKANASMKKQDILDRLNAN